MPLAVRSYTCNTVGDDVTVRPVSGPSSAARRVGGWPSHARSRAQWAGAASPAIVLGLCGVVACAFALRILLIGRQSAYMDEATFILTGRYLIEQRAVYAGAPTWTYGSYLWSLLAGAADMAGGLQLVRLLAATCGGTMALATALTTARLVPRAAVPLRWAAALCAGLIMALAPTAIAIGRFGTYDALAGAAFMSGIAVFVAARDNGRRRRWLLAAGLLFLAFLAKYLVAVYLPFICLYALLSPRDRATLWRNLLWFVAPLSAACAAYFLAFREPLLALLRFSTGYADLVSPTPLREYVWQRPEVWGLAALAALGWRYASPFGRAMALGGAAIMLGFHALTRPDFDFWKHSIYVIFFLAPPAGLAVAASLRPLLARFGRRGTVRRTALLALAVIAGNALAFLGLARSQPLAAFYPDLTPAVGTIRATATGARTVLTDDSAVRYYLYAQLPTERVTDPFSIEYGGQRGVEGYRRAVADRYFDLIVLDGGIGPLGRRLRPALADLLARHYVRVYTADRPGSGPVEVYRPREEVATTAEPDTASAVGLRFDAGVQGWGGRPDGAAQQPGMQVTIDRERTWRGYPTLRFTPTEQATIVGLPLFGPVSRVRAQVYIADSPATAGGVRVGMVGFDEAWRWRDDGFKQIVPPGRWVELVWELAEPGVYREIGLKVSVGTTGAVHIGQIEIWP